MERIKISELPLDTIVLVGCSSTINTVADILDDLNYYKGKSIYTTTPRHASFDADSILDHIIENESDNMYEDWDVNIGADIQKEDIEDLQIILDRILARSPGQNICYEQNKLIEIDI